MKRYIIFGFFHYYPAGGLNDIIGTCDTIEDLLEFIQNKSKGRLIYEKLQVLETQTGEIVDLNDGNAEASSLTIEDLRAGLRPTSF